MLDWLVALYERWVGRFVIVASPASRTALSEHLSLHGVLATVVVQETPTGMLDAILLARPIVEAGSARRVWITWCDQIGIHPGTLERLADLSSANPSAAVVMPTCTREEPYIHLQRAPDGRIERVLQRREGDGMPSIGESDVGLFSLSRRAFVDDLHDFGADVTLGSGSGERNFLPFVPWTVARGGVITFPCVEWQESVGVNTPDELAFMERYLLARARR
jgi:bifunctional N-acetylglucosamine-1-phosphate-uridyltransferase/glucosamine-1-phosphate-acetyltransferase GlmU-like protein